MNAQPWDWTGAHWRAATRTEQAAAALDQALADVRGHLHAAGIAHPDASHAEAMWIGARCLIDQLAPILLATTAGDTTRSARVLGNLQAVEDLCCAARDLWPPPRPRAEVAGLLAEVERLRRDHDGGGEAPAWEVQ